MSVTEKRVVAIVACSNAIEIQPINDEDDCLATIMNADGNDLTDRETEIADHMVNLWNENIS